MDMSSANLRFSDIAGDFIGVAVSFQFTDAAPPDYHGVTLAQQAQTSSNGIFRIW